jgi:hypothetical protein
VDASAGDGAAPCTGPGSLAAIWDLGAVSPSAVGSDALGNVYVAGSFKGSTSIGAIPLTATGSVDLFLAKLGPGGNVLSAVHFGATNAFQDPSPAIAVSAAGDVFMSGSFPSTLSFGGTTKPLKAILLDAFVVHFDPAGAATWADHFGYDNGGYDAASIVLDPSGDPVIGGTAGGTIVIGSTTWPAPDPAKSQAYAARLKATDGSVVWSTASGGTIDTQKIHVAVDPQSRIFLSGEVTGGESEWGIVPLNEGGTFRLGIDAAGTPVWSQLDYGGLPMSTSVDSAGRVAVVEDTFSSVNVGGTMIGNGEATVALLTNPADGTLLSSAVADPTFPWAGAADHGSGYTFVTGQYSLAVSFGSTTLPYVGPSGMRENLYLAQLDPTSHFVWATGLGAGNTQPLVTSVFPSSGRVAVGATTDTAFSTSAGAVAAGHGFLAVFTPAACSADPGPSIPQGDGLPGDLLDAQPPGVVADAAPAACPASQTSAVSGAACPVAMACAYGNTCCSCTPTKCGAASTTWTCDSLGTQPAACPASPPTTPGGTCPSGVKCNYCLPGGQYYADCTAPGGGGWSIGYTQVVCL